MSSHRHAALHFLRLAGLGLCLFVLTACDKGPLPVLGTLERDRIELIAEKQEPVVEVLAKEGDAVRQEQPVLKLDPSRTSQALAASRAALARTTSQLEELESGPRREDIAAARARLSGAEGVLRNEDESLARTRSMTADGVASTSDLDRAKAAFASAKAERDAARSQLQALERGTRKEQVDQARAARDEAQAKVSELEVTLDRLTVRATRDGIIDMLPFKLGDRPPAGGVVAVLLAGTPYARVYVPEALRAQVKPGSAATIHVDGRAQSYAGRVRTVATDAAFTPYFALTERDRGRLVYLAEIDLTDPAAQELPSGIPVTVDFPAPAPH